MNYSGGTDNINGFLFNKTPNNYSLLTNLCHSFNTFQNYSSLPEEKFHSSLLDDDNNDKEHGASLSVVKDLEKHKLSNIAPKIIISLD